MNGDYHLFYFGEHQPVYWGFTLPDQGYTVDITGCNDTGGLAAGGT
jgi:hypothetical protein